MDYQSEVEHFIQKLSLWREESHKDFSNIIQFHSTNINEGINDLVQEVSNLKFNLSMITRERNDLIETVCNNDEEEFYSILLFECKREENEYE